MKLLGCLLGGGRFAARQTIFIVLFLVIIQSNRQAQSYKMIQYVLTEIPFMKFDQLIFYVNELKRGFEYCLVPNGFFIGSFSRPFNVVVDR